MDKVTSGEIGALRSEKCQKKYKQESALLYLLIANVDSPVSYQEQTRS